MEAPSRIKMIGFPQEQYIAEETSKNQIVIHHTAGGGALTSIEGWKATQERIATHVVIDRDGTIYQCYSSKYWAYHLGLKQEVFKTYKVPYTPLDKTSLSIELANYGEVEQHADGKWYNEYGGLLKGEVVTYSTPFKGIRSFEKYTDAQIESLKQLLIYWGDKFKIPLHYNEDIWNISINALKGVSGVYTHVSYRTDKSDCHPQSSLIQMLKSLTPIS